MKLTSSKENLTADDRRQTTDHKRTMLLRRSAVSRRWSIPKGTVDVLK